LLLWGRAGAARGTERPHQPEKNAAHSPHSHRVHSKHCLIPFPRRTVCCSHYSLQARTETAVLPQRARDGVVLGRLRWPGWVRSLSVDGHPGGDPVDRIGRGDGAAAIAAPAVQPVRQPPGGHRAPARHAPGRDTGERGTAAGNAGRAARLGDPLTRTKLAPQAFLARQQPWPVALPRLKCSRSGGCCLT
jgi:hypothetical protein